MVRKWTVDRAYGGGGKEEKTYSQAFAKKLLSSPSKSKPPPAAVPPQPKQRERGEKGQAATIPSSSSSSSEPQESDTSLLSVNISLEGHGLDRGEGGPGNLAASGGRDSQLKKKGKRPGAHPTQSKNRTTISSSMFGNQEGTGARPTIERGGTNTISMEVSGVGSRGNAGEGSIVKTTLLSQTTKESFIRKKQRYQAEEGEVESGEPPTSLGLFTKPPAVLRESSETSVSTSNSTSAPVEGLHRRNRHKRSNDGSRNTKSHSEYRDPHRGRTHHPKGTLMVTDMDSSLGSSGGSSPQELDLALLESQVHANPEQAVRMAQQSLASEDWSNKCQGMAMIMCIARHYPHLLQPHLHTVLIAIQKEVRIRVLLI